MKISINQPFSVLYSVYQHECLGYLFDSFAVEQDQKGKLTFRHQNISSKNANEFSRELDERDYKMISLTDAMQQDHIIRKFHGSNIKPADFFDKHYKSANPNKQLIDQIEAYLDRKKAEFLSLIHGKLLYEMGRDGEPAWKQIRIMEDKATILFHFRKNDDNTHYFPTIKHAEEKVDFQYKGGYIVCNEPAWLIVNDRLYSFKKDVDGNKLKPFLNKKFIVIPKKVEETYYEKFVTQLVASFDVYAKGFTINTHKPALKPILSFWELKHVRSQTLFEQDILIDMEDAKIVFELRFQYGAYNFRPGDEPVNVRMEKTNGEYVFNRVIRDIVGEKKSISLLRNLGLELKNGKKTVPRCQALDWVINNKSFLEEANFEINQKSETEKKYFVGSSSISIEITENIDWFDINAVISFGHYQISFKDLRKSFFKNNGEIKLPSGEIAIIPSSWREQYADLFAFVNEDRENKDSLQLKKHHLSLVNDLKNGKLAKVSINKKLEGLRDFKKIEDYQLPKNFYGTLRPYQKAGYNWLSFLNQYKFGGCLADDMGLGKTVQTLALLQNLKENCNQQGTSLLVMPTSLLYNWEMEASKFTPDLKILNYTGTNRVKDSSLFADYDLILTSYGIVRMDIEELEKFYFNYIILDESQAIKNPDSNIARSVIKLKSRNRLILTGTPLENNTLDLWSQMSFVNPGLLGNQRFFKNEYQIPIEKKGDSQKTIRLNSIIKPFILRRHKSQVASDLPEKVEHIKYCTMTPDQEEKYEEAKSYFRNKILDQIEKEGMNKTQFMLLQGLTKLRQIANHPKLTDPEYDGASGKCEDVAEMIENALGEGHKILVFSQFVKHLSIIKDIVDKNNWKYAYLDGSTKNRKEQVEQFQQDCDTRLFLISLKAGGLGLNLTKADYVFLLDPWWNPAVEAQAVDRAHRIGQDQKVFTYKFISRETVEEKIVRLQQKKMKLASELISSEEGFMKQLTIEDITQLFE